MPRFKLTIEYSGTRYSGWQIQKNAKTVQGEIDRAVREVTGEVDVDLYGSGRTDAGVHAMAQVAHLDVQTTVPIDCCDGGSTTRFPPTSTCCASRRCDTGSTRVTTRWRAVTSTRCRGAAPHLASLRLVGEGRARRRRACARQRGCSSATMTSSRFRMTTPTEKSTAVLVEGLDVHEDGDSSSSTSRAVISSGRWSGGSSACWWKSAAAA